MTCVLPTTPWHHFNDHLPWLSMGSDSGPSPDLGKSSLSQDYVSSGSDARKSSTSSGKKRASRAGTRSVTTLSAAQLERKRANDREAQRAIRQRTKDHIDHLERSINDLRGSHEANEKIIHVTQQRNRELEEENAYLRSKLNEAGVNVNLQSTEYQRPIESTLLSLPSTSPGTTGSSIPRPGSTSTPSNHSVTTQSTASRHGSWQHQTAGFVSNAMGLPSVGAVANPPSLTTWRSHDTSQDPLSAQSASPYHDQRVEWPSNGAPYSQYVSQEQQRSQYETASSQQPGYQPPTYHTGLTPQSEYPPNISVSSGPSAYQVQSQATFPQPTSFQITPMQVPAGGTDYTSPHGQMQPPPLPATSFQSAHGEQTYGAQQATPPMHYRDEGANRSYSLSHYPTA